MACFAAIALRRCSGFRPLRSNSANIRRLSEERLTPSIALILANPANPSVRVFPADFAEGDDDFMGKRYHKRSSWRAIFPLLKGQMAPNEAIMLTFGHSGPAARSVLATLPPLPQSAVPRPRTGPGAWHSSAAPRRHRHKPRLARWRPPPHSRLQSYVPATVPETAARPWRYKHRTK